MIQVQRNDAPLATRAIQLLGEAGETVSVAESLTGGLLLAALTAVPGASAVVSGGVVAYSRSVKREVLRIDSETLARNGPVDREVARQMAVGVAALCGTDVAVSTTGVAGPGSYDGVPAGTFWVAAVFRGDSFAQLHHVVGDRPEVRSSAVHFGLKLLVELSERSLDDRTSKRLD